MKAEEIDFIPYGTINMDNIDVYDQQIETAVNNLENYDIPRMQGVLNKYMRVISISQPSNPEIGMAWFKLFN